MKRGIVRGFNRPSGLVDGKYFNISVVEGRICNGMEVSYEEYNGTVIRVIGEGVLNQEKDIIEEELNDDNEQDYDFFEQENIK